MVFLLIELLFLENLSVIKCSILQITGIIKLKNKYGDNFPNIENYVCEIEYSLSFKGELAIADGCITKEFSHSWDVPTQRYAYDFIILDNDAHSFKNKEREVNDYYCYSKDILAPAAGVIVEIYNKSKDSEILANGKFFSKLKDIRGNYIVIKHTEKEFTTLAHLQKYSIRVKVGDFVNREDIVARCGNTGNSTEPHLHFQLQDGLSFYESLGLPITFKNIELRRPIDYDKFDSRPILETSKIPKRKISRGYVVSKKTTILSK